MTIPKVKFKLFSMALTTFKLFSMALITFKLFQMASLSSETIQDFGAELIDFYSVHIGKGTFNTDPW